MIGCAPECGTQAFNLVSVFSKGHTHTHTHTKAHTHTHKSTHTHTHAYVHTHIKHTHKCAHIHTHAHTHTYSHTYTRMHTRLHTHTHTHTHAHTLTHIRTKTHETFGNRTCAIFFICSSQEAARRKRSSISHGPWPAKPNALGLQGVLDTVQPQ